MYDRMVSEHGYSIRKLADKLGKDKGYVEIGCVSRTPPWVRELVSLRKDTLSHAYELMKVQDPKRRRRLADQVARGELTLIKLRDKIEGRRLRVRRLAEEDVNGITPSIVIDQDLEPHETPIEAFLDEASEPEPEPRSRPSPRRPSARAGRSARTRSSTPRRRSRTPSMSSSTYCGHRRPSARSPTSTATISPST